MEEDNVSVKTEPDVKREQKDRQPNCHEDMSCVDVSSEDERSVDHYFKREKDQVTDKFGKIVDLNKQLLSGIVRLCRNEQLISDQLAHCFFANHTTRLQKQYIDCFNNRCLNRFDFSRAKINIVDHRRLTDMLANHNSDVYVSVRPEAPFDYVKEVKEFLSHIYALSAEDYKALLDEQVQKHYQSWWGGPENLNPLPIDPLTNLIDVDDRKVLEEREKAMSVKKLQEETQKMLGQQKHNKTELAEIAKFLSAKLYGKKEKPIVEDEVKEQAPSLPPNEEQKQQQSRHKKHKKQRREKEGNRKKSKKKKRRQEQVKQEHVEEPKAEGMQQEQVTGSKKVKN